MSESKFPVGTRIGKLVVVEVISKYRFRVQCDCGKKKSYNQTDLKKIRCCGCSGYNQEHHLRMQQTLQEYQTRTRKNLCKKQKYEYGSNVSKHPLYAIYHAMMHRCYDDKTSSYERYGALGVEVCARWRESFWSFVEDVGERPDGKTLDRIDPFGNYEPSNVRWATRQEQEANKRVPRRKTSFLEKSYIPAKFSENALLSHLGHPLVSLYREYFIPAKFLGKRRTGNLK